jgi:gamma-glutamylcysteine synthetase
MNREEVKKLIYQRFIEPTKIKRDVFAGVEIELPILNLNKDPVNFELIHKLTILFKDKFDFKERDRDENLNMCILENPLNNDIYTYDCSYNNLEFSFGKEKNLFTVKKRFEEYYSYVQEILLEENHTLTGFGVNPYRNYNNLVPIPSGRYRMLYNHLCTYPRFSHEKRFHNMPEFGMFTSASQVQLDVDYDNLISTIKTFSKLEPIKAILFSNSVLNGENIQLSCSRDMLWENSMQGYTQKNVGIYDPLPQNIEELIDYMLDTSIYCTEQDDKYINFPPILIVDYFNQKEVTGEYFKNGKYHQIKFKPRLSDFDYFRTFKFEDLTFRGTIEFRSVCCQPVKENIAVPAFHLGLIEKIKELNEILDNDTVLFNKGYSLTDLRRMFVKSDFPSFVDKKELKKLLKVIIDLSADGLKNRGNKEEKLLKPLYERAKSLENPAQRLIKHVNSGKDIEKLILEFSKI